MADFKRQHYVPKFYLRAFSSNETRKQINIGLLERDRYIQDAQLSKQCAQDYFYSKNADVEKALGFVEKPAGSVFRKLRENERLCELDLTVLRVFAILQYVRTDGQRQRLAHGILGMLDPSGDGIPDSFVKEEQTHATFSNFPEMMKVSSDLEVRVFRNQTAIPFITSDDPAVVTHKFLVQKFDKYGGNGLGSSGIILTLPLSPTHILFVFDLNIYNFKKDHLGVHPITDVSEVLKLNSLQILNAVGCIYFNDWEHKTALAQEIETQRTYREKERVVVNHCVLDEKNSSESHENFRVVTLEELDSITKSSEGEIRTMVHAFTKPLKPNHWPKTFKYKLKPRFIDTQTGSGIIRPSISGY